MPAGPKTPNELMRINCKSARGGSITLNRNHHVYASYAVSSDVSPSELFYSGAKLPDGRRVEFFLNRETGLVVVDVIHKNGKGGVEILRRTV